MSQLDKTDLGQKLEELRQEYEQILVKLESAEEESARAAEQIERLEAQLASLAREGLRQRQTILELKSTLARRDAAARDAEQHLGMAGMDAEVLREELQVANEELRASHQELELVNRALQDANAGLEAGAAERTAQLEDVVVQLSETVAQRDALLEAQRLLTREVDHRVKNSLQMVVSLLAMQAAAAESESEQRALRQACSRVQAVAHTHALLYRAGGSDNVPFQDYLAVLCQDLQSSLAPPDARRRVECRSDRAEIPADYALPLALLVNELVTNAFKHAFPDERAGRIEVSFRRHRRGWRLMVADDGVGLRGWPPPASPHGLGVRIVGALVERLQGRLAVASVGGTRFTLDFDPQQNAA